MTSRMNKTIFEGRFFKMPLKFDETVTNLANITLHIGMLHIGTLHMGRKLKNKVGSSDFDKFFRNI